MKYDYKKIEENLKKVKDKRKNDLVMTVSLEGTDKIQKDLNIVENKLDIIIKKYKKILKLKEMVK